MTRAYLEDKLHIAVVEYLRVAFPGLLYTHPANQGRSPQEGAKLKKMGVRAGAPDLLIWWSLYEAVDDIVRSNGIQAGGIELKSPDGYQNPQQRTFQMSFERIGGKYAVCRSIDEVRAALLSWGVPCRETTYAPKVDMRTVAQKRQDDFAFFAPPREPGG